MYVPFIIQQLKQHYSCKWHNKIHVYSIFNHSCYGNYKYLHLVKENLYFNGVKKDVYANITDQQLLDNYYADNNSQWLGILLQRYTMLLLGVCMKYLKNEEASKDAVQQIFLKVITELQKYKVDYFKSWLYMVARNHCLMKLRDKSGRMTKEISDNMPLAADTPELELQLERDALLTYVDLSLHELTGEQKTCVTLFYLEKKSYTEIAGSTGYTLMQVKSYIQNGKRNLKMLVEKKMKT
ncbi:sigma-70 family RNA polymerase sigma factor [soil metagenome]